MYGVVNMGFFFKQRKKSRKSSNQSFTSLSLIVAAAVFDDRSSFASLSPIVVAAIFHDGSFFAL